MKKRTFLELSDRGGDRKGARRSSCEPTSGLKFLESLERGTRVRPPRQAPRVKIDAPVPLEDMPWSSFVPVVSERFRLFLAEETPGHAQYLKVKMVGPRKLLPTTPYYLVNWLHVVDCIDFKRSEYEIDEPATDTSPARYDFDRIILKPSKVPKRVLIFRLEHYRVQTIIDTRLVKKIKSAGITGPQFYRVDYSIADEFT